MAVGFNSQNVPSRSESTRTGNDISSWNGSRKSLIREKRYLSISRLGRLRKDLWPVEEFNKHKSDWKLNKDELNTGK